MLIPDWLARAAAEAPSRAAIETPAGSLTYAELRERAEAAAGRLAARGVAPGDSVGLALPGGLAFAELLHGCWRLGAVPVPLDPRLGSAERALQAAGTALVLDAPLEGESAPLLPAAEEREAGGVAAVVHTSGSTGSPRPVALTFANFHWSAAGTALALGLDPEERWLCPLPVCHVGGLSILVRAVVSRTTAVVHERFEADRVAAALARDGVTLVSLVATTLARTLDAGLSAPESLRCAVIGGGPVPPALLERARVAGLALAQTYGLTETCSMATISAIGAPGTAGRPIPPAEVSLSPDGEILVAGGIVAPGAAGADGRLRTGDLGSLDGEGRLTVTGRRSHTIVTGGENVSPPEVEAVLEAHPAVAEAAVHGRPDDEWGEAVVAVVVLEAGAEATAEDLRGHARAGLSGFKVPKEIVFAGSLPRTAAGKLRRADLPGAARVPPGRPYPGAA